MNSIHYLCDDIGLTKLKSREIQLRLLDKKKITEYRLWLQLINILLPLLLLLILTTLFFNLKKHEYA